MRWRVLASFGVFLGVLVCSQNSHSATSGDSLALERCGVGLSLWQRARRPKAQQFCGLVARGIANLRSRPELTVSLSERAIELLPHGAEAHLLRAQAQLRLGHSQVAQASFQAAILRLSRADLRYIPATFWIAAARAEQMLGQYEESLRHYRRALLLPDWHDPRERARVLVEAATAASYAGPENSQETRTYLRVAIQQNSPLLRPIAAAALVLSLLRDGRLQEAQRVAAGSGLSSSFQLRYAFRDSTDGATWDRIVPILPPGEATAMAVALAIAMGSDDQSNHLLDYEQEVTGLSLPSHIAKGMVALGLPGAD